MRRNSRRGSAAIEFGLIAPLMILICISAMDLARSFRPAMVVSSAARAGLHYAALSETNAADMNGIEAAARRDAGNQQDLQVEATRFCTCSIGGDRVACTTNCTGRAEYVQVEAQIPFGTVIGIAGVTSPLNVRDTAVFRVK
jgi:Flp pilus assembly protein TadG